MPVMTDRELRVHCVEQAVRAFEGKSESWHRVEDLAKSFYEFVVATPRGEELSSIIDLPTGEKWRWSRRDWQWVRVTETVEAS